MRKFFEGLFRGQEAPQEEPPILKAAKLIESGQKLWIQRKDGQLVAGEAKMGAKGGTPGVLVSWEDPETKKKMEKFVQPAKFLDWQKNAPDKNEES